MILQKELNQELSNAVEEKQESEGQDLMSLPSDDAEDDDENLMDQEDDAKTEQGVGI